MENKYIPLTQIPINQTGRVYEINAGRSLEKKLSAQGIYKGVEIRKLSGDWGPTLISVKQTKLGIGRGMANKIIMEYKNE